MWLLNHFKYRYTSSIYNKNHTNILNLYSSKSLLRISSVFLPIDRSNMSSSTLTSNNPAVYGDDVTTFATVSDYSAKTLLLNGPRGAYTTARSFNHNHIFELDEHIARLSKTTRLILEDQATKLVLNEMELPSSKLSRIEEESPLNQMNSDTIDLQTINTVNEQDDSPTNRSIASVTSSTMSQTSYSTNMSESDTEGTSTLTTTQLNKRNQILKAFHIKYKALLDETLLRPRVINLCERALDTFDHEFPQLKHTDLRFTFLLSWGDALISTLQHTMHHSHHSEKQLLPNTIHHRQSDTPSLSSDAIQTKSTGMDSSDNVTKEHTQFLIQQLSEKDAPSLLMLHLSSMPPPRNPPIRCIVRGHPRHRAEAKDSQWVHDRRKLEKMMSADIEETVLFAHHSLQLLEGLQTNFFAIKDGIVYTAGENVLEGTVRHLILELCQQNRIPLCLEAPLVSDCHLWDAAFISSTSRQLMPINELIVSVDVAKHIKLPIGDQVTSHTRINKVEKSTGYQFEISYEPNECALLKQLLHLVETSALSKSTPIGSSQS